jgi:hypothetical protein
MHLSKFEVQGVRQSQTTSPAIMVGSFLSHLIDHTRTASRCHKALQSGCAQLGTLDAKYPEMFLTLFEVSDQERSRSLARTEAIKLARLGSESRRPDFERESMRHSLCPTYHGGPAGKQGRGCVYNYESGRTFERGVLSQRYISSKT